MNILNKFNDISIRSKIFTLAGVLITALVVSIYFSLSSMQSIDDELKSIASKDIPLTKVTSQVAIHQLEQAINLERALRYGAYISTSETAKKHFDETLKSYEKINVAIYDEFKQIKQLVDKGLATANSEKITKRYIDIEEKFRQIETIHSEFVNTVVFIIKAILAGDITKALEQTDKIEKLEEDIDHALINLLYQVESFTEESIQDAEHHERAAINMLITISIVTAISTLIILLVVTAGVSRLTGGLTRSLDIAQKIADGDLTEAVESDGNDEIGKLLSALGVMRDKLHNMITQMNQASTELSTSSEELASVSEDSNKGIHQQQSEIQQAATAMNEMTAAVQEVASNAQLTSESANEANKETQKGKNVVDATVVSIQSLAGVVDNAAGVIQQVGNDSDNIGTVLDVIKGIAEQTNLLALNAAIEAARAGEQGRGFAVVADEVRTLAKRTQESTSEIEDMISRLQDSSKNAINAMDAGREQANTSVSQATEAGSALAAINEVVARISDMNTQIASAAEEQTTVAEEVNHNITVISQVAEQNAAAVNQITASSEELSRMAVSLQEMISQFQI